MSFHGVDYSVGIIAQISLGFLGFVVLAVCLGFAHHAFDIIFIEVGAGGDCDLLCFARVFVLGGDTQDAVSVDIKRHFDFWQAAS